MEKKKNGITELVFIIDGSGSMSGLEKDTVGGFNSFIAKQRRQDGQCYVSTVIFNTDTKVVHDRVRLSEVRDMTEENYVCYGCTALYDAIGGAVRHISNIHKYARKSDVPENTVFVITTDGLENASHRYSESKVRSMIEEKKKLGWQFIFIGANIDSKATASEIGIDPAMAVDYHADSAGTQIVYEDVCDAVCSIRCSNSVSDGWRDRMDDDYKSRK